MQERLTRLAFEVDTQDLMEADIKLRALGSALDKLARKARTVELTPFRKNATRKLKNMIFSFAMNITNAAMLNTPVGDESKIDETVNFRYFKLYESREDRFGIEMTPGFHQGAWVYSETKNPQFDPNIYDMSQVTRSIRKDFKANYNLGDTFYIAAKGPAFGLFESGVIPTPDKNGIVKPTMDTVMAIYRQDMIAAYKAG